ncbi:uncharacterized protein KGF55_000502 [Candida pseudojiufengensis]|uniref:uncharacterized protein n=1 Tax=Candida pseudojiufengensis TaxID=497109 RepID=UPI002224AFE8|nr:uncharacterized protein KGF55_000502 [Candida pseudojiufengensis]KAI5966193.1 hypothetical protein KGF55_000502 [Candida pseudojiufengensis]
MQQTIDLENNSVTFANNPNINQQNKTSTSDLEQGTSSGSSPALSRQETYLTTIESQSDTHDITLINRDFKSKDEIPVMGNNKPFPPPLPKQSLYKVSFDGQNDPTHPFNWKLTTKLYISAACCVASVAVTLGSAMFAASQPALMEIFNIGWTPSALATSLFVFGFASGPIIWGPASEIYGRKLPLLISCFGFVCFSFAVATAKDIQTIMLCRFFAGFVGSAPLVVVPAIFADIFDAETRSKALGIFSMLLMGGPLVAPVLGGFTIKNSDLGWRWNGYFIAIVGSFGLVLCAFIPETLADVILIDKAVKLRNKTGIWGIYAPHENLKLSIKEICQSQITRPIVMLFTEPILFLISLYNAFVYGILYLFLTVIPMIFTGTYGWSHGVGELPYLAMFVGTIFGGIVVFLFELRSKRIMKENNGIVAPEVKLLPMMVGSVAFTIGIFWLGWAGGFGTKVHWIVPVLGTVPIGVGLIAIFLPCLIYLVDCYIFYSASAIAANTFLRSSFGGIFPIVSKQLFENLEIKWASTLIGCISAILVPVPFLFYFYGKELRRRSKYCASFEEVSIETKQQQLISEQTTLNALE